MNPSKTLYRPNVVQTVTYTDTAGTSAAFNAQTYVVRVVCTTAAFVLISQAGTAATTANGFYMPSELPEYFQCNPGEKISVVKLSGDGSCYITEMT